MARRGKGKHQKNTISTVTANSGLFQRQCVTCGQHTLAGGVCPTCEQQGSLIQRDTLDNSSSSETTAPTILSQGFRHDISQVPTHPVRQQSRGIFPSHNSPPTSGPGSRLEPLIHGRRSAQPLSTMRSDAYYQSPVNPNNPVLVWTDGTHLFFASAQAQIDAGRSTAAPEPALSLPAGYVATEIHWDRRHGLTSGGGALVIFAHKPGKKDLEIAISNNLEQRFNFIDALGVTSGASAHITRQGGEFIRVNDSTVPLELSGATAPGEIHRVTFTDGFLRYRASTGSHDLYIARGANPSAHLVERVTGNIIETFPAGTIQAIVPEQSGVVRLEQTQTFFGFSIPQTRVVDLRTSPPTVTNTFGHSSAEAGYVEAKERLQLLGVSIEENGVRFRVAELEAIESALTIGGNRGLAALLNFRRLEGMGSTDPILDAQKSLGPDAAFGFASAGGGTPLLSINEPFETSALERTATVRHEMTHIIMGAIDAQNRASMTPSQRANLEGAMRYQARQAQTKARAGQLRAGEYGLGDAVPGAGTQADWRNAVGDDPAIASIWVELLKRYTFIPDPEGTGEFRGASLADESRYSGSRENVGHPADSVGEFVASFVTCATLFRSQFMTDVLAAEAAGNARGGRGGSYVRGLYRRAWNLIDSKYVPLGSNPF